MTDSVIEKLQRELLAAEEEIRSAERAWVDAKKRYYKVWEREYEFAKDDRSVRESLAWQRSAERDFVEAEERKKSAQNKLRALKRKIRKLTET